jgi:hypothetical protein
VFGCLYICAGIFLCLFSLTQPGSEYSRVSSFVQAGLFLLAGAGVLQGWDETVSILWLTAVLGGVGTIARGLIPLDILAELITVASVVWYQEVGRRLNAR